MYGVCTVCSPLWSRDESLEWPTDSLVMMDEILRTPWMMNSIVAFSYKVGCPSLYLGADVCTLYIVQYASCLLDTYSIYLSGVRVRSAALQCQSPSREDSTGKESYGVQEASEIQPQKDGWGYGDDEVSLPSRYGRSILCCMMSMIQYYDDGSRMKDGEKRGALESIDWFCYLVELAIINWLLTCWYGCPGGYMYSVYGCR